MVTSHVLGFPRIGPNRETKKVVEEYWAKKISRSELLAQGKAIRAKAWETQSSTGLDLVTVGDFAWYDHVLDTSVLLGVIPPRFKHPGGDVDLDTMFRMGRGRAPTGIDTPACEMTKWFDTNYHYMVPEFQKAQEFSLSSTKLFDEVAEAKELNYRVKPVILGPISYLYLGKEKESGFQKIDLLEKILPAYKLILQKLAAQGIEWVQIDEPVLGLDISDEWRRAYQTAYEALAGVGPKTLLATYFVSIAAENISIVTLLPVAGVHLDLVRGPEQVETVIPKLKSSTIISLGVVNGRNVWRNDLSETLALLKKIAAIVDPSRLWVSSSCSLLHSPVDLESEKKIASEVKQWLAFAKQKVIEVVALAQALSGKFNEVKKSFEDSDKAAAHKKTSKIVHNEEVKNRVTEIDDSLVNRANTYPVRAEVQRQHLNLPPFPTTTIGSFPQTAEIRSKRQLLKSGKITEEQYVTAMQEEIKMMVKAQEEIGIDVLVHGEPERNDMVEYFGELLEGFAFTNNGWVQSYGSRCVKPPIIYGDVYRSKPMTVDWIKYAQECTKKHMKGMLTGPVTILCWSFVRDDQPRETTANQIALALRDEVTDLEKIGVSIIQIDEPAFREGLPLRKREQQAYLDWAVKAFKLSAGGAADQTQIHTHMCYSEFNELIKPIADMDADVITIETSRSDMKLLDAFENFNYPNEIGPGVYDIHSPRIPTLEEMVELLKKAANKIDHRRLWVNPDCGLKTRGWPEVNAALQKMVTAALQLREIYAN